MESVDSAEDASDFNSRYVDRARHNRQQILASRSSPRKSQEALLAGLLSHNASSTFGREHGFSRIRTLQEFRSAVPVRDYGGFSPWIDRAAAGERNVLSADDPIVFFKTSGSTGSNKVIPVTRNFMETSFFPFYYAAIGNLFEYFPGLGTRPDAILNLRVDPLATSSKTASGSPHLGASQVNFGRHFGELLAIEPGSQAPWVVPPISVKSRTELDRAYVRLRLAIEYDIECVVGINPAVVSALPHQLSAWLPTIVKELFDGTVAGSHGHRANRERAKQLEKIQSCFRRVQPAHIWPNIGVLYCWTGGIASLYMSRLRESFGMGVTVLPAPIAASEGPVALALDRHATAGSLVTSAVVYEFIPADEEIRPDSATLDFSELEQGEEYHVIISHIGGLYRYALGDVIRVIDWSGGVPRVEYAGRSTVANCAGERLREAHILEALHLASSSVGAEICNAVCRQPAVPGECYSILLALRATPTPTEFDSLTGELERSLSRVSAGYRDARKAGRLKPLSVQTTSADAFYSEWEWRVLQGARAAQAKDRMFVSDEAWARLQGGASLAAQAAGPNWSWQS
jgi:GH3 auxin-responsive promoter